MCTLCKDHFRCWYQVRGRNNISLLPSFGTVRIGKRRRLYIFYKPRPLDTLSKSGPGK